MLPLNPPGFGNSPYNCLSSVAGNPMLISPQRLLQQGMLSPEAVADVPDFHVSHVEYDRVAEFKTRLLREAWSRFQKSSKQDGDAFQNFQHSEEQRDWLHDFAVFMALKRRGNGAPWWMWDEPLARREPAAMARVHRELKGEIGFQKFKQYLFSTQWKEIREAARSRGVRIMGDVPIYVAADSADVWANRDLFQLDDRGLPTVVAGVPPDYFSATGQRWGNPLYRWEALKATSYRWWITRLRANLALADVVRLDHFRGFAAYWEVPANEPTAVNGRWMPGPGLALFEAMREALGDLPIVAEDLGFITQEVHDLRNAIGLPGMKILQFGFSQPDSLHLPHRFSSHTVVYTGTHDNDTARGWYEHAPEHERELARMYLGDDCRDFPWALTRAAFTSVAETAIVPVQDILGLGSEARMNRPGAERDNWSWRLLPGALTRDKAERLRRLAEITGRL